MNITGGGAIPRDNLERMDEHAERYYREIRKRTSDIESIAKNTGFSVNDIEKVKQHLFFNVYELGEDEPRRFDPSYDIAVSWQRLSDGKDIQEIDKVLLNHELVESQLMNVQGMGYREAHEIANEQFDYQSLVIELDRKAGIG